MDQMYIKQTNIMSGPYLTGDNVMTLNDFTQQ